MSKNSFYLISFLISFIFSAIMLGTGFYIFKRFGNPFPRLFHEINKKLGMTLGLGVFFFGFYFAFVTMLPWIMPSESFQKIMIFFYHYKIEGIYLGLFVFSFVTLSIYLARLFIKSLYR